MSKISRWGRDKIIKKECKNTLFCVVRDLDWKSISSLDIIYSELCMLIELMNNSFICWDEYSDVSILVITFVFMSQVFTKQKHFF